MAGGRTMCKKCSVVAGPSSTMNRSTIAGARKNSMFSIYKCNVLLRTCVAYAVAGVCKCIRVHCCMIMFTAAEQRAAYTIHHAVAHLQLILAHALSGDLLEKRHGRRLLRRLGVSAFKVQQQRAKEVRLLDRRHAVGMCRKCADHSLHRHTRYIAAGVV